MRISVSSVFSAEKNTTEKTSSRGDIKVEQHYQDFVHAAWTWNVIGNILEVLVINMAPQITYSTLRKTDFIIKLFFFFSQILLKTITLQLVTPL